MCIETRKGVMVEEGSIINIDASIDLLTCLIFYKASFGC